MRSVFEDDADDEHEYDYDRDRAGSYATSAASSQRSYRSRFIPAPAHAVTVCIFVVDHAALSPRSWAAPC